MRPFSSHSTTRSRAARSLLMASSYAVMLFTMVIPGRIDAATWGSGSGGDWFTASNWVENEIPAYRADIDLSQFAVPADRTITMDVNDDIGNMTFGDTDGSPDKTTLAGTGAFFQKSNSMISVSNGIVQISNRFNSSTPGWTTKTGTGTLVLTYSPNSFNTSGLSVAQGSIEWGSADDRPLGFNDVVQLNGGDLTSTSTGNMIWVYNILNVETNGGTITFTGAGLFRFQNLLTGNGQLILQGGNEFWLESASTNFAGTLALRNSETKLEHNGGNLSSDATIDLGAGTTLELNVGMTIGGIEGSGNIQQGFGGSRILTVGNTNGVDHLYSGRFSGAHTLVKNGGNTQTLNGTNAYTGSTTISQGTLATGTANIPASTSITIAAGAVFAPAGNYAKPGVSLSIGITGAAENGRMDGGGTVNVSGIGLTVATNGYAPIGGNIFTVLTATAVSGTFATTNLPVLGTGLTWDVSYQADKIVLSIPGGGPTGYTLFAHQITNGLTGIQDDAEEDGYQNLLEYVTKANPTNADNVARMGVSQTGGVLQITFTRDPNATAATLIVEGANSVGSDAAWTGINTNKGGSWSDPGNVVETGVDPLTVTVSDNTNSTQRSLRLRVTLP